jgi:hypothetical protein
MNIVGNNFSVLVIPHYPPDIFFGFQPLPCGVQEMLARRRLELVEVVDSQGQGANPVSVESTYGIETGDDWGIPLTLW